jgi:hypothetical protein
MSTTVTTLSADTPVEAAAWRRLDDDRGPGLDEPRRQPGLVVTLRGIVPRVQASGGRPPA